MNSISLTFSIHYTYCCLLAWLFCLENKKLGHCNYISIVSFKFVIVNTKFLHIVLIFFQIPHRHIHTISLRNKKYFQVFPIKHFLRI